MWALTRTLKSHGYYALNDSDMVPEIRGLEKEDPLSAWLRDVLYDLEGSIRCLERCVGRFHECGSPSLICTRV